MTATERQDRRRRLERAGFVALSGWAPAEFAAEAAQVVEKHRAKVERIIAEPPAPRGRPKKPTP